MTEPHKGTKLCSLCPRRCQADRGSASGLKKSLCGAPWAVKIALVSLHPWEEPCISGRKGAGTVFFSHCNMRCCFCQNYEISRLGFGKEVSEERLEEIFFEQQARGASCLELVTPGHYTDAIIGALSDAKKNGLRIPVVYNSNAYELPETLLRLRGLVDVFLPDLKYFDPALAVRYSGVRDYFAYASEAIQTMYKMTGPFVMRDGIMIKGVIVRHLVLPGCSKDSIRVIDWLCRTFKDNIYISVMNQYTPVYRAHEHPEINRRLFTAEYLRVVRRCEELGLKNVYIQEGRTNLEKFIPVFNAAGV